MAGRDLSECVESNGTITGRRRLLSSIGAVTTFGLSGCLGSAESWREAALREEDKSEPTGGSNATKDASESATDIQTFPDGYGADGVVSSVDVITQLVAFLRESNLTCEVESAYRPNGNEFAWRRHGTFRRDPEANRAVVDYQSDGLDEQNRSASVDDTVLHQGSIESEFESQGRAVDYLLQPIGRVIERYLIRFDLAIIGEPDPGTLKYNVRDFADTQYLPVTSGTASGSYMIEKDGDLVRASAKVIQEGTVVFTQSIQVKKVGATDLETESQ